MKSLICVLIFSFCMYGQIKNFQPDRKNLKSYHLRGKVTQITTSSYEPKLSNDGKSYIAGTWLNSETIIFNKNGYVDHLANSQWDYMNQSAKPYEFEGSTERFKFNYDSLNNLISVAENGKPLKEYLIDDNNNFIGFKIKFKTTKYF